MSDCRTRSSRSERRACKVFGFLGRTHERLRFRVSLHLVPTAEGGRRGGIKSSYRCQWRWAPWPLGVDDESYLDAAVIALQPVWVEPGQDALAELEPVSPEFWSVVSVGQRLSAYEGRRRVADAIVQVVLT